MPPKAKAKPKAKAASKDAPRAEVPPPPLVPRCLPVPEPLAGRCAAERRLLLAWADPQGQYRVQLLPYTPGVTASEEAADWADVDCTEQVHLPSLLPEEQAWLVPCEHVRLRYRLVTASPPKLIDGKNPGNGASAASEPVASFVDPPVNLQAEAFYDDSRPFVALSWQSSNTEWLRKVMGSEAGQAGSGNPFEALPGLLPTRVQVRWRPTRVLRSDGSLPSELPGEVVSPAFDSLVGGGASFRSADETWTLDYRGALQGVAARFSVRMGTRHRWSPWSDETPEVQVEVPEPKPLGLAAGRQSEEVSLRSLGDREATIVWPPFSTEGTLSEVEYRVMVCPVDGRASAPDWESRGSLAAILHDALSNELSTVVRGLQPNTWYVVRVDTRYSFVGNRAYSVSKAVSAPFLTKFPGRPPLSPQPVADGVAFAAEPQPVAGASPPREAPVTPPREAADRPQGAPDEEAEEGALEEEAPYSYDWSKLPWVALRVESSHLADYAIEYKEAGAAGREACDGHFEGWRSPEVVEVAGESDEAVQVSTPRGDAADGRWQIVRVGLGAAAPEAVVCRLVSKTPLADVSPLKWSVVTQPLVPFVAPAALSAPSVWGQVSDGNFRLVVRFFLRPAPTMPEEHAATMAPARPPAAACQVPLPGHRFVTRCQLRWRRAGEEDWAELPPRLLPEPRASHGAAGSGPAAATGLGTLPQSSPEAEATLADLAARLGWCGVRYEVEVDPATEPLRRLLAAAEPLALEVRVGSERRWSAWAAPPEAPRRLLAPVPAPLAGSRLACEAVSATRLSLSWPPFGRLPGATRVDYVLRAVPAFADPGGAGSPRAAEAAGTVQVVVEGTHAARQPLEELLQTPQARSLLDGQAEVQLPELLGLAQAAAGREREADLDPGSAVKADVVGLLPCTRYAVTVRACYPATGVGGLPSAEPAALSCAAVTPGGAAPPAAPRLVPLGPRLAEATGAAGGEASEGAGAREAVLDVESLPGYALEYRAAGLQAAHFDALGGAERSLFGGSWQADGGPWHRVPSAEVQGCAGEGGHKVRVTLPPFGSQPPLPDVVEFRLRALARSAAHPCRWAGGISEPVAVCIAPPHRRPLLRHVITDDRWCVSVAVDLFKGALPPTPPVPLCQSLEALDEDDPDSDQEHDGDMQELRKSDAVPLPPLESWQEDAELGAVPVGYGHRMVTMVQLRYSIHAALEPALRKQIEGQAASKRWQLSPVVPISSENLDGSRCTLELGSDAGPAQGGVYLFQARLGDGRRWSAWSPTSVAFSWRVPPPVPPVASRAGAQPQVMAEVTSSSSARVRWGDFRPAPGLVLLEYELLAVLQEPEGGIGGPSVVATSFQHRYRGGVVEHDITGLIPLKTYVFAVQARYPQVGGRAWAGRLESAPVALDQAETMLDPPAPCLVADTRDGEDEAAQAAEGAFALVEYPDEEEGMSYTLQYALAVGPDADAEMRTNQGVWCRPLGVAALDTEEAADVVGTAPRWRAELLDVQRFRSEPLALALLQRVCLRLRAQGADDAPSARLWSSPSAPVSTGIAPPEALSAAVVAAGRRLALRAFFSLDLALAEALAAAGPARVQRARADLQEALQRVGDRPAAAGTAAPGAAHDGLRALHEPQRAWPRGFGHAFVTRCQLRLRWLSRASAGAGAEGSGEHAGGGAEGWGAWFHCPDVPLPEEACRDDAGSLASGPRGSRARWFSTEALQPPGRALMAGDVVQVAVRVGDGLKWSAWRGAKELTVAIAPPRPAQDQDTAKASWVGDACTVRWPAAAAAPGLDSIEYQVTVHPDSGALAARIAAVFDGPAAAASSAGAGPAPAPARAGGTSQPQPAGGGRLVCTQVSGLCRHVRYSFTVSARYPAVGSREYTRLFQTEHVAWRPGSVEPVAAPAPGAPAPERPAPAPPAVEQVPVPRDSRRLAHWEAEGEGMLVLLRWRGLEAPAKGGPPEPLQFEVHASEASPCAPPEASDGPWVQSAATLVALDGEPLVALRRPPFVVSHFRLVDAASLRAGPASAAMPAVYERVTAPPVASMRALGRGVPRALGAELRFVLGAEMGTHRWATLCQVRFRALGAGKDEAWDEMGEAPLGCAGGSGLMDDAREATVVVREEDGLDLGSVYEFAVRVGDSYRFGPWSTASRPMRFAVSPPCAREDASIRIQAEETSAVLSWDAFGPDAKLAARLPSFAQLPVTYTVSVFSGQARELVTRLDVLGGCSSEAQRSSVIIPSLLPGVSYSASLVATWSRFGSRCPFESGEGMPLLIAFTTRPSSTSLAGRGGISAEVDRTQQSAASRFLEPSSAQLSVLPKASADGASVLASSGEGISAKTGRQLPRLIPMLPAKFHARDPLTMAAIPTPRADRPAHARSPRPAALKRALASAEQPQGGA